MAALTCTERGVVGRCSLALGQARVAAEPNQTIESANLRARLRDQE